MRHHDEDKMTHTPGVQQCQAQGYLSLIRFDLGQNWDV